MAELFKVVNGPDNEGLKESYFHNDVKRFEFGSGKPPGIDGYVRSLGSLIVAGIVATEEDADVFKQGEEPNLEFDRFLHFVLIQSANNPSTWLHGGYNAQTRTGLFIRTADFVKESMKMLVRTTRH